MNWLVYHIVSGQAFFSGIVLVVIAATSSTSAHPICARITVLSGLVGAIAIAVSSAPIPYWYYGIAISVTMVWVGSQFKQQWRRWPPYAVILVWVVAGVFEIPYHVIPALRPVEQRAVTIIGDSLSAGMGGEDSSTTWPRILADEHGIEVHDLSHVGETAASALRRARSERVVSPLVIIEIGGNDLLGRTSATQFASDLDALLAHVTEPDRQVVMFELPLPPFRHGYGRIQRVLARKHDVALVPKRVLLSVLAADESTLDTIHLSQAGHERMAARVRTIVERAFAR
jgi:acyl-CoA thioesterase-1